MPYRIGPNERSFAERIEWLRAPIATNERAEACHNWNPHRRGSRPVGNTDRRRFSSITAHDTFTRPVSQPENQFGYSDTRTDWEDWPDRGIPDPHTCLE